MSNNRRKIYYLILNTKNNGGNRVVFEHVTGLLARGYDARVITIYGLQPKWFPLKIKIEKFYSLLFKNSDILVATFWPTVYISLFLRAKKKFHLIQAWEEDFYTNKLIKIIAKYVISFPIQKIVISDYLKNKIHKHTKVEYKIIKIYGNAVDSIFKFKKKKFNLQYPLILSTFSNYKWYKGFDLYLEAVNKLRDRNYKFILATTEKKKLSPQIKAVLNPSRKKLATLYQTADVFLSTSRSEGFLLPVLEAMASGCPVIATNSGGVNEYAENGYNSIILNKIDELWKGNIIKELIENKNLRSKLVSNGLKTANKFKWEKIVGQLEIIYNLGT